MFRCKVHLAPFMLWLAFSGFTGIQVKCLVRFKQDAFVKLGLDSRNLEVGILLSSSSSSLLLSAKVSLLLWGTRLDELTPAVTRTE